MSIFHYPLEVGDPSGSLFEEISALVDTDATFTVVPASILERLGVARQDTVRIRLADDRVIERDIGETRVRLEGKTLNTVVVFGDEDALPVLGEYIVERALLAVASVWQRLLPTEALLMEAARRIDEWSRIETRVPHLGVVPRLAEAAEQLSLQGV